MDYVAPAEIVSEALLAAEKKSKLPPRDLFIRGTLGGGILAYAASLAYAAYSQGLPAIVGAIVFPVGFVMLILLGLELSTGGFALLPAALVDGRIGFGTMLKNWMWVYAGNLLGSVIYAVLFYLAVSNFGTGNGGAIGDQLRLIAQKKTIGYAVLGAAGWGSAFVKAILCNWMVTLGVMLAFASRSTTGKILAMWLPITTFFAHGYEHSVVNMFAIPAGMMLGAPVSFTQWWWWNEAPVTLGNIIGGAFFTGIALWSTFGQRRESSMGKERRETADPTYATAGEKR
jgi:formate/nitrite transporter